MGLLMLAGLIGSVAYSGYVIKKDIQSENIDYKTKPTTNTYQNKKKVKNNFNLICKRAGIDVDNNNNPTKQHQCHKGIEYLQYQGYKDSEIEIFKNMFLERYNSRQNNKTKKIIQKNNQLISLLENQSDRELVMYRKRIYKSNTTPQERMSKILNNDLWKRIVHHHTYIRSDIGQFEEIWTLKVPKTFFKNVNKHQLYDDICYLEGIYNGF